VLREEETRYLTQPHFAGPAAEIRLDRLTPAPESHSELGAVSPKVTPPMTHDQTRTQATSYNWRVGVKVQFNLQEVQSQPWLVLPRGALWTSHSVSDQPNPVSSLPDLARSDLSLSISLRSQSTQCQFRSFSTNLSPLPPPPTPPT